MTTVIWHNGILYSDSRATRIDDNGNETHYPAVKLHTVGNKIYGMSGDYADCLKFVNSRSTFWSRIKAFCKSLPNINGSTIMCWDGKRLYIYINEKYCGKFHYWKLHRVIKYNIAKMTENKECHWHIIGSGRTDAGEAMAAGLTPVEAIHYAADRDSWTDYEVKELRL